MNELILGGARSGKSQYAEQLAINSGKEKHYIATAQAYDDEMRKRIQQHQQRRIDKWINIEEPYALTGSLFKYDDQNHFLLVDCLTIWASNLLHSPEKNHWQHEKDKLLTSLSELKSHIVFVSNEVGSGIVPTGEINRRFVDELGWLHQDLSKLCDKVTLVVAGLPTVLKG